MRKQILASTAIGVLLGSGGIGAFTLITEQGSLDYEAIADVPPEATELLTRDKDTLLTEATKAGALADFTCEVRTLRFGRTLREVCWCEDGDQAGWESSTDECRATVTVSDGAVFTRERTVIEAEAVERVR